MEYAGALRPGRDAWSAVTSVVPGKPPASAASSSRRSARCHRGRDGGRLQRRHRSDRSRTPPPTDPGFDPKPDKCKVTEHGEKVNSEIKIAFIKFGENAGFIETTYSDGTVTYTATDGASLGVTGGFGTKLDIGKVERGAKVDFGAGVNFDYGSTWTFENAERGGGDAEAARRLPGRAGDPQARPVLRDQVPVERCQGAAEAAVAERDARSRPPSTPRASSG